MGSVWRWFLVGGAAGSVGVVARDGGGAAHAGLRELGRARQAVAEAVALVGHARGQALHGLEALGADREAERQALRTCPTGRGVRTGTPRLKEERAG